MTNWTTMNKLIIYLASIVLFLLISSCGEERFVSEFTAYNPTVVASNDGKLSYQSFDTYPILDVISSDAPALDITSAYKIRLDTIKAPSGSSFQRNNLTVDIETGVISYDNTNGNLSEGQYVISILVQTVKGIAQYDDIVTMTVREVPATLAVNETTVDVGALELGVIATASFTDNSGSGLITEANYELINAPENFEMDPTTGEIIKTGAEVEGSLTLSIKLTTNLGTIEAFDIITIRVGPAPTIAYFQQDGSTPLTNVILSPWTAYMTSAPSLDGMTAASWEVIVPDTLADFASAFSAGTDGEIMISPEANLPEGEYLIGVAASNAGGVTNEFPDLFTVSVETRWTELFNDQIDNADANVLPEESYPGIWAGYDISGSSTRGGWKKVANVGAGGFTGMRRWDPGDLDACLVRTVDITGVKAMRVSFGEIIGYGAAFLNRYSREFHIGESIDNLAAATYDASEWTTILPSDGPWQDINWNMGGGPQNDYINLPLDLSSVSGNSLYLMWRLYSKDPVAGNQNGQFIITYITAEHSSAFDAEEE
ncbi:MAG: hypothetical protein AAF587_02365 [Bacteroidota bacterium]